MTEYEIEVEEVEGKEFASVSISKSLLEVSFSFDDVTIKQSGITMFSDDEQVAAIIKSDARIDSEYMLVLTGLMPTNPHIEVGVSQGFAQDLFDVVTDMDT